MQAMSGGPEYALRLREVEAERDRLAAALKAEREPNGYPIANAETWRLAYVDAVKRADALAALLSRSPVSRGGAEPAAVCPPCPKCPDPECHYGAHGYCKTYGYEPAPNCVGKDHSATAPHPCPTRMP
jgi:hypothetical protein